MDKWEYITCTYTNKPFSSLDVELDEWGKNGWELVSILQRQGDEVLGSYDCVFKRKIK